VKDKADKLEAGKVSEKLGYDGRAQTVVIGIPRSCYEIKKINSVLAFGEYTIDPDGMYVGNDPTTVICDETGNFKITLFKTFRFGCTMFLYRNDFSWAQPRGKSTRHRNLHHARML